MWDFNPTEPQMLAVNYTGVDNECTRSASRLVVINAGPASASSNKASRVNPALVAFSTKRLGFA